MSYRRVVITGLGLLSPVGNNVSDSWKNILSGTSGAKTIDRFDVSKFETQFAATVDIDLSDYLDKKEIRRTDPFIQYGLVAADECLLDSSIDLNNVDKARFGVSIGSGIGGLGTIEDNKTKLSDSGPKKISPFFVPGAISNMVSGYASLKFGLQGPNISIASECSSASLSIGYSFRNIAYGDADSWALSDIKPYFDHTVDVFGVDRIIWGSDSPVCNLGGGLATWVALTHNLTAEWSKYERNCFYNENAKKLWTIEGI